MEPLSLLQTLAYRGREEEREGGSLPQREPPIKGEREERRGRERDLPFFHRITFGSCRSFILC
jgi:hypothetical protein